MPKRCKDLTGTKINHLSVMERIPPNTIGNEETFWKCKCDCGKILNIIQTRLSHKNRPAKSCGCIHQENLLPGTRFGKLVVIESIYEINPKTGFKLKKWKCKCDCGIICNKSFGRLSQGYVISCGCQFKKNQLRLGLINTKYEPRIKSARKVYQGIYDDGDLTFEDFYKLSQQNCFYCGSPPLALANRIRNGTTKPNGEFYYNGIDRIDPAIRNHVLDNSKTSCFSCNVSKGDLVIDQFFNKIIKIHNTTTVGRDQIIIPPDRNIIPMLIENNLFKIDDLDQLVRIAKGNQFNKKFGAYRKRGITKFNEFNLSFYEFCYLTSQNCYYCGDSPSNYVLYKENGKKFYHYYNGLDRKITERGYLLEKCTNSIDNVLPCCKFCNYAKRTRSYNDFLSWAEQVYNHSNLSSYKTSDIDVA